MAVHNEGRPIAPEHDPGAVPADGAGRARAEPAHGGIGLGLFIVQAIAQRHGGSVQVESSAAAGTTFTMLIPCG